jgi:hypothetical protein
MQYRLRTLLIVLAIAPPLMARAWFTREQTAAALQRTNVETWICLGMVVVALAISLRDFRRFASSTL